MCKSIDTFNKEVWESDVRISQLFRRARWLSEEIVASERGKKHEKDTYISSPVIHKVWEKNNHLLERESQGDSRLSLAQESGRTEER